MLAHGSRSPLKSDPTAIEDVSVVCYGQSELEMLLDNHNGDIFDEVAQALGYLFHNSDPHALGRFIEQQELGTGQHGAADRQHFTLTARKCSCYLVETLTELREPRKHLIDRWPRSVREGTNLEILAHGQLAEYGMLLRHIAQT